MKMATNLKMIGWSIDGNKGVEAPVDIKPVCDEIQKRLDRIQSAPMNAVYKFGWPSTGGIMATFDIGGRIFVEAERVDWEAESRAQALAHKISSSKIWGGLIDRLTAWMDRTHPADLSWLGCDWED